MSQRENLVGRQFGRLRVVKYAYTKNGRAFWHCVCECGAEKDVVAYCLTHNKSQSCGCYKREYPKKNYTLYVGEERDVYRIWNGIKSRCYNPNRIQYKNYGQRGIAMCSEWKNNPASFIKWALNNGYKKGMQIDRIDNNGNYEPSNCRWSTAKEQANNRRTSVRVLSNGKKLTIEEYEKKSGITKSQIDYAAKHGRVTKTLLYPREV